MANERILILAGGDWSRPDRVRDLVASADHVVAANGGCAKARLHGIHVDEVIGDLDSIPEPERRLLLEADTPVVHAFSRDKDWTDLELAIDHALRRDPARIDLFGTHGSRLDHALTSLHLLEKGLSEGVPIVLHAGAESARLVDRSETLDGARVGDRVSLIPVSASAIVTTEGLRYPLRGERLQRAASRGVSNEVTSCPVRIDVDDGLLLLIHAREGEADLA